MAFAVEVEGEANPLSAQNVLHALVLAASSTQQQVQTGTQQLQNWEKQGMYYTFLQVSALQPELFGTCGLTSRFDLQDVFLDHAFPNEVRYLAIIQLKNGIDKYWRKTAAKYGIESLHGRRQANIDASAIKKEEKEQIKTRALEAGIIEPALLLALHNSLMIAKIMRYEFPQDWYVYGLVS
jgi:hypothetical protein